MKKLTLSSILLGSLLSFTAFAGTGTGTITQVIVHRDNSGHGVVMFTTQGNTDKAPCSTVANEWAFSLSNELGKAMYSLGAVDLSWLNFVQSERVLIAARGMPLSYPKQMTRNKEQDTFR
ncbi:hypothetical protein VR7878_02362 [Vibrio ruber DSM 16370]|uniref:Uncharacterized protein n=1 Tax=Vibrio ruber (strain DSM 16370 / JCM 11486 / BCRC 17186 / CECT 7878 / LMG 23124 / VR1) TaxID=1123498 RepID=A0A1R4LLS0_VIBR1|nr:hypothetical protein [Vibrio ruber]SJN57532.1 hypothetical protein VR7878_02362 [Vibrio ruber DSM 16370]